MSKRFTIWGFAVLLVAAFATSAWADTPQGNRDAIRLIDHLTANAAPAPAEAIRVDARNLPAVEQAGTSDAGCQTLSNSCLDPYYIWTMPGAPFIYDIDTTVVPWDTTIANRVAFEEGFTPAPGARATPCTVLTAYVFVYDWVDELAPVTMDVSIYDDNGSGAPGTALATVTLSTTEIQTGIDAFDFIAVDFSSFNIVIPAEEQFHVVMECPTATPGVDGVVLLSDGGLDDPTNCPEGAANANGGVLYSTPGYWESHAEHWAGFQFGMFVLADVCCEPIPPDCYAFSNSCGVPAFIWSVPGTANTRIAWAQRYQMDPIGTRECTLKTVWTVIYDWIDTAFKTDVDLVIYDDDVDLLPGTELARVTIPAATVDANLYAWLPVDVSSFNLTAPPGAGLHASLEVPDATPGTSGIFVLSDEGYENPTDCPEGANNPGGEVFYTSVGVWETHTTHFGGSYGTFIDFDVCCPPLLYALCTPGTDGDWATQGNNFARTNYTPAGFSTLCGLNTVWSYEFDRTVEATSSIVTDDYLLVTSTDSIHCLDRTTGAEVWSVGGFPNIVGVVRGAVTVDGGGVYVGGANAQAFTKYDLATGAVVWARVLDASQPPNLALEQPGPTQWSPPVVADGYVYFTQETGYVYKLDAATGLSAVAPLDLPDPLGFGAIPYNGLSYADGKLYVGTGDALGSSGALFQIDAATLTIDWTLVNPGNIFYPGGVGDPDFDPFSNEGFPGPVAIEDGILYYHSYIRLDPDRLHFPQTGAVGAIDLAVEDGTGAGILWVNDANATTVASPGSTPTAGYDYASPAVGPGMVYLNSRGYFGGTTEQDGVSAWDKGVGTRVWYQGYTNIGNFGGVDQFDDVRGDAPITVFCQEDQTPYLFVGNVGGVWRLYNGNTGNIEWERTFTGFVRQTAVVDDWAYVTVRSGGLNGGGAVVAFNVGADRPRLQIDSQYVFRAASPLSGASTDDITDAFRNLGCLDLNVSAYNVINPPDPLRVSSVNPILAAASERSTRNLGGYDALLDASNWKDRATALTAGVDTEIDQTLVRGFANYAGATADPLFLTVNEAAGTVAPGASQSINVTYDETGLTNNTGYVNYIELVTDDPDYYPQDPSGATLGLPSITFNLFIGCPDATDYLTGGLGDEYVTNFGATADGDANGFIVNGNAWYYDGGFAVVVTDSSKWAFDGCSVAGYPRRAGEFGPTEPCGLSVATNNYDSPLGAGADEVQEVTYNMIDLASTFGYFTPSTRQCGGVFNEIQRVMSTDADYGDFALGKWTITNEVGMDGDMPNVFVACVTDWDVAAGTDNHVGVYPAGYTCFDGGALMPNHVGGYIRLDDDAAGSGKLAAGGAPVFMMADIQDDQGHGENAYRMMDLTVNVGPTAYADWVDANAESGVVVDNTDMGGLIVFAHYPLLAEGASETFYFAVYQADNGANATWSDMAGYEAAVAEIMCRAKAFAGFGKGDVNCDGYVDLQDVVLLGNILDGLYTATGGGVYSADVNADNAYTQADYDLLYDVVAGVQPASAMSNAWRF